MTITEIYETYKENGTIKSLFENGLLTVNNYVSVFKKQQEIATIMGLIIDETEEGLKYVKAMDYEVALMLSLTALYVNGIELEDEIDGDVLSDMLIEMGMKRVINTYTGDVVTYCDMFDQEIRGEVERYNGTGAVLNRHLTQLNEMLGGVVTKLTTAIDAFDPSKIQEYAEVLDSINATVNEVKEITK